MDESNSRIGGRTDLEWWDYVCIEAQSTDDSWPRFLELIAAAKVEERGRTRWVRHCYDWELVSLDVVLGVIETGATLRCFVYGTNKEDDLRIFAKDQEAEARRWVEEQFGALAAGG